ncbi:MAG: hypothetical protein ABR540_04625 [Acidimicrobiales bacterium]|nr:hypothetical protein [Actinomycetota bacterium]
MDDWHPRAVREPAARPGVAYIGVPWKLVLHTVEGVGLYRYNPDNYFGHQSWPHATIDERAIHQHLPISVGGYALFRGGVATNTANVIQCEIMGQAGNIANLPAGTLANIADWLTWCSEQTGVPLTVCPQGFHGPGEGIVLASETSPIRFGDQEWLNFSGVCGHQHVGSGNDHWDPGAFPWARLGLGGGGAPVDPWAGLFPILCD